MISVVFLPKTAESGANGMRILGANERLSSDSPRSAHHVPRAMGYSKGMGEFSDKVFEIVCQVPRGKVTTYGQVAALMGRPQSGRYVGFALRNNPAPAADGGAIPCHRVLFKDGSLCEGFAFGGPEAQREMLQAEGVTFVDDTHVDLKAHLWDGKGAGEEPDGPPADFDWEAEMGE